MGSCWIAQGDQLVLCADQRCEMEIMGGRFKREQIHVYLWLIDDVVQQKLAQHCKAIIFQYKIYMHLKRKKKLKRRVTQRWRIHLTVQGTQA